MFTARAAADVFRPMVDLFPAAGTAKLRLEWFA
jgi:hypothetical protein